MKDTFNENTQELAVALLKVVRDHYTSHAPERQRVFEVLNALAVVSAMIVGPIVPEPGRTTPRKFFFDAFRAQVRLVREHEQGREDAKPRIVS